MKLMTKAVVVMALAGLGVGITACGAAPVTVVQTPAAHSAAVTKAAPSPARTKTVVRYRTVAAAPSTSAAPSTTAAATTVVDGRRDEGLVGDEWEEGISCPSGRQCFYQPSPNAAGTIT